MVIMENVDIGQLFARVVQVSKAGRKSPAFDGLAFWQPIKRELATSEFVADKWLAHEAKSYREMVMNLAESHTDGRGTTRIDEKNHFIIQTVRIPADDEPTLRKIIQLALNVGQYHGAPRPRGSTLPITLKRRRAQDFISTAAARTKLSDIMSTPARKRLDTYLKRAEKRFSIPSR